MSDAENKFFDLVLKGSRIAIKRLIKRRAKLNERIIINRNGKNLSINANDVIKKSM